MADRYEFAVNMSTNVPEEVRRVLASLEQLQRAGQIGPVQLAGGGQAALTQFIQKIEQAAVSGKTLDQQARSTVAAFRQLAKDAPQVAQAMRGMGPGLFQGFGADPKVAGLAMQQFEKIGNAAFDAANRGATAFTEQRRSITAATKAAEEAQRQFEALAKASGAYSRAQIPGATAPIAQRAAFTNAALGQKMLPAGGIDPGVFSGGTIEKMLAGLAKVDTGPVSQSLRRQFLQLQAAIKQYEKIGDIKAATGARAALLNVSRAMDEVRQAGRSAKDGVQEFATRLQTMRESIVQLDRITGGINVGGVTTPPRFTATGFADDKVEGQIEQYQRGVENLNRAFLRSGHVSAALKEVSDAMAAFQAAPSKQAAEALRTALSGLQAAQVQGLGDQMSKFISGVQGDISAGIQRSQQAAIKSQTLSEQAGKRAEASAQKSSKAQQQIAKDAETYTSRQLSQANRLAGQSKAAADAAEGHLRKLEALRQRAEAATTPGAVRKVDYALIKAEDDFNRARARSLTVANEAAAAYGNIDRSLLSSVQSQQRLAQGITETQQLQQRAAAALPAAFATGKGVVGSEIAAARQRIAADASLKQDTAATLANLKAAEKSRVASNDAFTSMERGFDKFRRLSQDIALTTTTTGATRRENQAAEIEREIAAARARGVQQAREAVAQWMLVDKALLSTNEQLHINARLQHALTEAEKIEADATIRLGQAVRQAAAEITAARQEISGGAKKGTFLTGFRGTDERTSPQMIGQTARITLLYGTGYRLLSTLQQIVSDAFNSLTEFQVGLVELGEIFSLSANQVQQYGRAVLEASARTGAAAEDLLKGTERVTLVGGQGRQGEELVQFSEGVTQSLGELAMVTGQSADDMSRFTVAIGQASGMTGDFVRTLGDSAAFISKQTGATVEDLLKSTAQVGDMGVAIGLTTEEIMAISGVIQTSTGQTADAVAGYLSQIFGRAGESGAREALGGAGVDVTKQFGDQLKQIMQSISTGDIGRQQAIEIANAFGRGRVATAFLAMGRDFDKIAQVARIAPAESPGTLQERFGARAETFQGQIAQLRGQFEELVVTIGLMSETFALLLKAVNILLDGLNGFFGVLAKLNIGGVNVVGAFLAIVATLRYGWVAMQKLWAGAQAAGAALARLSIQGQTGGAGLGAGSAARGRFGQFAAGFGAVATAATAGVAIFSAFQAEIDRTNDAVKATTDSFKGLESVDPAQVTEALSSEAVTASLDAVKTEFDGAAKTWQVWRRGELKNRLEVVQALLEGANVKDTSATGMFITALRAKLSVLASDEEALREELKGFGTENLEIGPGAPRGLDSASRIAAEAWQDNIEHMTGVMQKAVEDGAVNAADGISQAEAEILAALAMPEFKLENTGFEDPLTGKLVPETQKEVEKQARALLIDQLLGATDAASKVIVDLYEGMSKSAGEAYTEIKKITDSLQGYAFNVPLFSKKTGVSGPGNPIPELMKNLAIAYGDVVEAQALGLDNLPQVQEEYAKSAATVQQALALAKQQADLAFKGKEETPQAIQRYADILQQQIIATGGNIQEIIRLFSETSIGVANLTIAQLKAARDALVKVVKATQDRLRAVREQWYKRFPSLGMPKPGVDVPKEEGAPTPQEEQAQKDLDAVLAALEGVDVTFSELGTGIIGAANAAEKTGDTMAQIAAAAELASATRGGDLVAIATAKLHQAEADLAAQERNTVAYYNALAQVYEAQNAYADAVISMSEQHRRAGADLTNPLVEAQITLETAQARVADAIARGKAASVIEALKIEERAAANALEETNFRQLLAQIQTNRELGRATDREYLSYLESERARLAAIAEKTEQQRQQLNEVDKLIKGLQSEMAGQFNFGDIDMPTMYEVRRYVQTVAAGLTFLGDSVGTIMAGAPSGAGIPVQRPGGMVPGPGTQTVTNNFNIDGADIGMVRQVIVGALGATESGRTMSTSRKI